MNTIEERLAASDPARRDEPLLTEDAAAQMLAAIVRDDRAPRRSRRRRMAIGGLAISLAVGGTALAGGGVPSIVGDALKQVDDEGLPVKIDGTRRVASRKDGLDVLELYKAPAAGGGRCWSVVRRSPSGDYSQASGTECARGDGSRVSGYRGLDISVDGAEGEGWLLYGQLPANVATAELRVPGEPPRPVEVITGARLGDASQDARYVIERTSPDSFEKGYLLLIRDRRGTIIERQREKGEPKMCTVRAPNGVPGVKPC